MSADPQPCEYELHNSSPTPESAPATSPFMRLPLELRLAIYGLLFTPRTYRITTHASHKGRNPSTIQLNLQQVPKDKGSSNYVAHRPLKCTLSHIGFPLRSLYPEILRVCRQARAEAEPLLYGARGVVFDFGIHLEALLAFWADRSPLARANVRALRFSREIPHPASNDGEAHELWARLCGYLKAEMTGLRKLDLTIWNSSERPSSFPASAPASVFAHLDGRSVEETPGEHLLLQWREWNWIYDLDLETVECFKVTWWRFQYFRGGGWGGNGEGDGDLNGDSKLDSWMAGSMMEDRVVRRRLIEAGIVVEGSVVLPWLRGQKRPGRLFFDYSRPWKRE